MNRLQNKLFYLSLSAIVLSLVFFSSYAESKSIYEWSLQQHSHDKNLVTKPAIIQYTNPDEGDSSYAVHAALKGTLIPEKGNWEYNIATEWHKNTLTSKEQDTRSLSLSAEGSWGDIMRGWGIIPDLSLAYKNDSVNNAESSLVIAETGYIYGKAGLNKLIGPSQLKWYWSPVAAIEDEYIFEAKDNGPTGNVIRLFGKATLEIFPFFSKLDNGRLSLYASYSYWYDLSEDSEIDNGDDSHDLVKCGLSWRLTQEPKDNEKNVAVFLSLERVDGENPRTNRPNQEYTMVSIGVSY
jgi:hypothetical protein